MLWSRTYPILRLWKRFLAIFLDSSSFPSYEPLNSAPHKTSYGDCQMKGNMDFGTGGKINRPQLRNLETLGTGRLPNSMEKKRPCPFKPPWCLKHNTGCVPMINPEKNANGKKEARMPWCDVYMWVTYSTANPRTLSARRGVKKCPSPRLTVP